MITNRQTHRQTNKVITYPPFTIVMGATKSLETFATLGPVLIVPTA